MNDARVAPLKPDELDEAQKTFLKPFTDKKGRFPNIFGVLCRHMPLLDAWSGFGLHTMRTSQVDPVLREVLVLRTSHNVECAYEWHHHEHIGRSVGLSDAQMAQIRNGATMENEDYNLMIRCADDLAEATRLSDETWRAMIDRFGLEYTLDVVFTVGAYTALAMGLKSCGVQIEGSAR